MTCALWYIMNESLNRDAGVRTMRDKMKFASDRDLSRLQRHPNLVILELLNTCNPT